MFNFNFFIMKKDYVSLKVQTVEVQLSDCIAGSNSPVKSVTGVSSTSEADGLNPATGHGVKFSAW